MDEQKHELNVGNLLGMREKAFQCFLEKYFPGVKQVTDNPEVMCVDLIMKAFEVYYRDEFWRDEQTEQRLES